MTYCGIKKDMKTIINNEKMLTLFETLKKEVPALSYDKDEWVKKMMKWHFSDETGTPFWLKKKKYLKFDPINDIKTYDDLEKFGLFDKKELRGIPTSELIPRGFLNKPKSIYETGGTTGEPIKVVDVITSYNNVKIFKAMIEARGIKLGEVLAMTPSGPHAYGNFVRKLVNTWAGRAFFIDFDPRWIKKLIKNNQETQSYINHLLDQTENILKTEKPSILFTTPKLLIELVLRLSKPLEAYGIELISTGGTSCTEEEVRYLQENYLMNVQWIDTYGNTLMGHALQGDPWEKNPCRSYYLPPPLSFIEVVDPDDWHTRRQIGEEGRILLNTLLEDLFIPNLLERDSATVAGIHPWFPWNGVSNVHPYIDSKEETAIEGVY